MLGARSAFLADRHLRVLLYLIKGKVIGVRVHNQDMEFKGVGGNRLPSEVNEAMKGTFPANIEAIVKNHYHGNYSLIDEVTISDIAYDRLVAFDDEKITRLAKEIRRLRSSSDGNS